VFGAVFAGHAIKEAITNEIELASELEHTATRTGMGAEALQILGMQAKQSGVPFEVLTASLAGLTKNVGLFAAGAPSRIKSVFKVLKIGVKDVKGMAPEDLFWKIGQGIASIADPTQKLAFAQRVFGESGALMLDMFKGTPAELAAAREAYAETGAVFSEAFVKQAHKADLTLIKFGAQLRRLKVALIAEVLPGILRVVDKLLTFSKALVSISKSSNALQGAFLAGGWMVFAKLLARLVSRLVAAAAAAGGFWKMLAPIAGAVAKFLFWALILDDIISTGGTIVGAAKILREQGAKHVFCGCVHGLLIGDAEKRILDAGVEEIVGTDSVPGNVSKVSLAPLISQELKAQQ